MKNLYLILGISLLFASCKDISLNNSFIYFSEPQPTDVAAIKLFPKKFIGIYSLDTSDQLIIEPKLIIIKKIEIITVQKSELDSVPEFELRNSQVYNKTESKAYKTFIKGDTISFELESRDTVFKFASNEIAKEYKSSLVLNRKVDDVYQTSIIKISTTGMSHIQLGSQKDFNKLNMELKIPFDVNTIDNDTINVILTPSRSDFRKLLRKEGFKYESRYSFNKRGGT